MKIATFCSGIGSPDLAAKIKNWEHVFISEVDPHACSVLARHFPSVPNLGDMTKIKGAEYRGAVDIVIAGTPCQGFSIAGKRGGLDDDRSHLALRFVELLAEIRPRWFVWENVPGVFSSNGGSDLANFLGALSGQKVRKPSGGWKNSGILPGIPDAYGLCWRTLDAQYFGVPQRRRRVFVVGHLGDWRPPAAVLIDRHCVQGHPAPRGEAGQSNHANALSSLVAPVQSKAARHRDCGSARGKSRSGNGLEINSPTSPAPTLTSDDRRAVIAFSSKDYGADATVNLSPTLRSGEFDKSWANGGAPPAVATQDSSIRRLTPLECERLQGFPDGWTQVEHKGKPMPDGARYKMCGNSIAVPVISWILERIQKCKP